jgi:enamine deaminase RidA (YjgF/YER057c/UK114 family)
LACVVVKTNASQVYAEFFGEAKPARTTVVAAFTIPNIRVEIDAIAYRPA